MAGRGAGGGGGESVTKLIHGQSGIFSKMYYGLSVAKKGGLIMVMDIMCQVLLIRYSLLYNILFIK